MFSRAGFSRAVPWYVWCGVAAVTSAMVGTHWDISWHRSIGRDSFWTPAHIAIYMCGVLAGISCGYLILSTTLNRRSPLRQCSVEIWGFRGPLGAFLSAWGGLAMIASAPFDDWWHKAYGLDVKILSPPHMVLAAGIMAVHAGALILILGQMNRASETQRARLHALFLYVGGMILVSLTVVQMEITHRGTMQTAHFYGVVFLAVFAAVQWPFAGFLMSPAARNAFFGARYYGYYVPASSLYARYQFYPMEPGFEFWKQAAQALATAVLSMRLGLAWGNWMQCIRR